MQTELTQKILELKKDLNAIILAHNYQLPEIQDIADYTGDSLGLSIEAAKTQAETITFCGVHFMAETAKIINPKKTVLMPEPRAGCPMANMINQRQLFELKREHPGAKVVCYINSTAEIKSLSDICCTSGNAVEVVRSLGNEEVIFVPDQYLGSWVEKKLRRTMILWNGFCHTHMKILPQHIIEKKKLHPDALVMAHPECSLGVTDMADIVASTTGMINYPSGSASKEFIVATETAILYPLQNKYPDKRFYPAFDGAECPNMKLTTLEKVLWCLQDASGEITVPEKTAFKAKACIEKMLALSLRR
jgi:quinolinate synthase